jgi:hypothetical protein
MSTGTIAAMITNGVQTVLEVQNAIYLLIYPQRLVGFYRQLDIPFACQGG